jgi:hypothetical protein
MRRLWTLGPRVQKDIQRQYILSWQRTCCVKRQTEIFFEVDNVENVDSFYEYEFGISDVNVKGRLKKSVELREQIGTSKFILDVIKEGYIIPLLHKPEKTFLRNN